MHVDKEGRHYLGAHGLDPYSLVYSRGRQGKVDHISHVVHHIDDLLAAEELLTQAKIACGNRQRLPSLAAWSGFALQESERHHHRIDYWRQHAGADGLGGHSAAIVAGADLLRPCDRARR